MTTVASRTFKSMPFRSAEQTWIAIVDLITKGIESEEREELLSVLGIASSLIADKYLQESPIILTCDGPRTRIYCLYDDSSLEDEGNEGSLGFNPLTGNWAISLPSGEEDLSWVQTALAKKSNRITARKLSERLEENSKSNQTEILEIDQKGFLGI